MPAAMTLTALFAASPLLSAAEPPLTVQGLMAEGWEIAGYASGYDNRTSLILFRHPEPLNLRSFNAAFCST